MLLAKVGSDQVILGRTIVDGGNTGTLDNPIVVKSFGDEQYAGCTGYPADSHVTIWLTVCFVRIFANHAILLMDLDVSRPSY
jgi:hypothetical protein